MTFTIRDYDATTDAERVAEIVSTARSEPVSAEAVRGWERERPEGQVAQYRSAVDGTGRVVGRGVATHDPWEPPDYFWTAVDVDPAARGRGVGRALYDDALAFARTRGANHLEAEVRDGDPDSLAFAQRRGFAIRRHLFESTLDLATFDESRFAGVVTAAEAQGFRFFTLADSGNSPDAQRTLYDLNKSTGMDVPGRLTPFRPFEAFRRQVFEAPWYRADAQIVARDPANGDRWVGMAALGFFEKQVPAPAGGPPHTVRHMYNMMTGVERDYRGRGLATALKLLSVRCARRYGAAYLRTNNDSENAPMLAINCKLGYVPEPGRFTLSCRVDNPA